MEVTEVIREQGWDRDHKDARHLGEATGQILVGHCCVWPGTWGAPMKEGAGWRPSPQECACFLLCFRAWDPSRESAGLSRWTPYSVTPMSPQGPPGLVEYPPAGAF